MNLTYAAIPARRATRAVSAAAIDAIDDHTDSTPSRIDVRGHELHEHTLSHRQPSRHSPATNCARSPEQSPDPKRSPPQDRSERQRLRTAREVAPLVTLGVLIQSS